MGRVRTALLVAAVASLAAAPGALACPEMPTLKAFSPWGDEDDYFEVPGGSFEDGLSWSVTGAATLVADDNPLTAGPSGLSSVQLGPGDQILSPALCVDRNHPHIRYAVRSSDSEAKLKVHVLWIDEKGEAKEDEIEKHKHPKHADWELSGKVKLKKALPKKDEVREVRLRFSVEEKAGSWLLDDVYLDPTKRG